MAQIPKGRLVKGPYKPICRDCAIYFSITVICMCLDMYGLLVYAPVWKHQPVDPFSNISWLVKLPGLNIHQPPEIAGVPYDQGLASPLVSLNKAGYWTYKFWGRGLVDQRKLQERWPSKHCQAEGGRWDRGGWNNSHWEPRHVLDFVQGGREWELQDKRW